VIVRRAPGLLVIASCLLPAACGHGEAFTRTEIPPNPVLDPLPPRRLTFSSEGDWSPAWLPDGSAIGYSYFVWGRTDRDRCLGFLPPEGGRISRSICVRADNDLDTANAVSFHAVSPGGRLALVADAGLSRLFAPNARSLYLGRLDGDSGPRPVLEFPRLVATGQVHYTATNLVWLNETTLIYLATFANYVEEKIGVPGDTVLLPIEMVRLDLEGDSVAAQTIIPGSLGMSSICLGTRPNTVAFTRGASGLVSEYDFTTGQITPLYDFDTLGIAREVQIAGGRLVAIVGGRVTHVPSNPLFGFPFLADSGGPVYAVDLPSGAPRLVADTVGEHQFRRPALAPSGRRVVVEEYGFEFKNFAGEIRRVVSKQADLWMFEVP